MTKALKTLKILSILSLSLMLGACASTHRGDAYERDELGKQVTVRKGTVLATRIVKVEGDHEIGTIAGAVIGGALASEAGGSDAVRVAAGVAGAVVGGAIGAVAQRKLTEGEALEVIVRHEDEDNAVAIIQDGQESFGAGQKVLVLYGQRIRVTADNT